MVELKFFLVKGTEGIISKINKILSETPAKPAEILNLFSSRFFFFFNPALLDSLNRTFTELFNN
jgi:hypothetical protein